jgi:hypothetical protein
MPRFGIRASAVLAIPNFDLTDTAIGVGTCSGVH